MKKISVILAFLLGCLSGCKAPESAPRVVEKFNAQWHFRLGDSNAFSEADFDDSGWRVLNLPHDWSIEGTFSPENPAGVGGGALPGGVGWYRKSFTVSPADSGMIFRVGFDGVYMNSEVWINGYSLGKRPNGYIGFCYNLTPFLVYGDKPNVIAVRVDNSAQPNSRWYSGSGIYRNVWLTKTSPLFVSHWGTSITTPEVTTDRATVKVATDIRNLSGAEALVNLEVLILDPEDRQVATVRKEDVTIHTDSNQTANVSLEIAEPLFWSPDLPALYTAVTKIFKGDELVDESRTRFGIRTFHFSSEKGFFLNGKSLKLLGVCMHHDLGALGAAVNYRALQRQMEIMKDMGVNAIRTSHNPPAPELLQICDEMGLIVMDEAFDMWARKKSQYDYSIYWDEWHVRDLSDQIRRDRNHPSVMIWSIGNEIGEQWDSTGVYITRELASVVRKLDNTRPITTANNNPYPDNYLIKSGALDLIGFNYHHEDFVRFPEVFPNQKFIATETNSALMTRGHYDMPADSVRVWPKRWDIPFNDGNADNTCSAYDNCRAPWGSTHAETWKLIKKYDFLSGMFIWTGFDYLGEPTPYQWPSRSSYFGVVDLAGFPKDIYYMYQSEWTNDTVLHVFPHWNWTDGQIVDVVAYYNQADEVELFLNNESLGVKSKHNDDLQVQWHVPFKAGTLRAESRRDGDVVAVREISTAGLPARIEATADRLSIDAGGDDLSFITIRILDSDGNLVPRANNMVKVALVGDAAVAGVDNGCQTSHHSFQAHEINAFNGMCLVIIRSGHSVGDVEVLLKSEGLKSDVVTLNMR